MEILSALFYILFFITSAILMLLILFRPSESSGLGGAFGGMGSEAVLGVRATQTIDKIIGISAGVFILLAVAIARCDREISGAASTPQAPSQPTR